MNLYNKNFRFTLISNMSNSDNLIYETRPFIALSYNSFIDINDIPDFSQFNYNNALFLPLDRIKVVKNDETGDIEHNDRRYSYLSNTQNFDSFDDIMNSGIEYSTDLFYYLYLQKIISLDIYKNIIGNKINQTSLILVHKKDNLPFKYENFNSGVNDEIGLKLDSAYNIFPLSLDYITELDLSVNTAKYLNYEVII